MGGTAAPRILYMEDDDALAHLIKRRLERHGWTVDLARNGREGLEMLRARPYDAVAVDYHMPELDGLGVIRALADAAASPPAIMISGSGNLKVAVEAMKLGAADYVVKEVDGSYLDLLPSAIQRLLDRQRLIGEKQRAERALAEKTAILEATFANMDQGVAVFDADLRLVAWNEPYLGLYDYPPELARVGQPLEAFLRHNAERGEYGPLPALAEAEIAQRLEHARTIPLCRYDRIRPNGRFIEVRRNRLPGGGFVATHTDLTEHKRAEEEQAAILENSLVGIALVRDRRLVRFNAKFLEMFGYPEKALLGHTFEALHPTPEAYQNWSRAADTVLVTGGTYSCEEPLRTRTGTRFWCRLQGKAIHTDDVAQGVIWVLEDITERKKAEESLLLSATVFNATAEGIVVTNTDNRIEAVNPAFTAITGYEPEEILGRDPQVLKSGRQDKAFYQKMWDDLSGAGRWEGEVWNRHRNGEFYAEWLSITMVPDDHGRPRRYVGVFHDITHKKEHEEVAWHRANYDALTGLPNRSLFLDRLTQAVAHSEREGTAFALLFLDLDGFKAVNDAFGHASGDTLLEETAGRLLACVRSSDTVARLGGDEFTVILASVQDGGGAADVAHRILAALAEPFRLGAHQACVHASIGIALCPIHGQEPRALIERADFAMYQVKKTGKNAFHFYSEAEATAAGHLRTRPSSSSATRR